MEDWVETAKAHVSAKVEHPFRVMKQPWGFQKTWLRGIAKNHCKVLVMAGLTNLYLARRQLIANGSGGDGVLAEDNQATKLFQQSLKSH